MYTSTKTQKNFVSAPVTLSIFRRQGSVSGFTLIELLVSSSIFVLIIIVAISSLLAMTRHQKNTQFKKQQLDTINAVMEDMVRNIRTSSHVRCDAPVGVPGDYSDIVVEIPKDCINEVGDDPQASLKIAIEGVDGLENKPEDQILYWIKDDGDGMALYKSITGDAGPYMRLTPGPIEITYQNSGFSVLYSENTADQKQPFVTLRLSGTITYQNDQSTFNIQTAVTPRAPEF